MASHTKKEDNCFECRWESFHLDSSNSENSVGISCPIEEHDPSQTHCEIDETCCDDDNCSITCPSVCDGFVDCNDSDTCSVAHCDDTNCHDTDPVCFDNHCFGTNNSNVGSTDNAFDALSFFGMGGHMDSERHDLLPSTIIEHSQAEQVSKPSGNSTTDVINSSLCTGAFFAPDSITITPCHLPNYHHFPGHDFAQTTHHDHSLVHQQFPVQNEVNPAEVFHMLEICPDFNNHFHVHEAANCPDSLDSRLNEAADENSFACLHLDPSIADNLMKNTFHMSGTIPTRGPCRSSHRCRTSSHAHIHPYSPYSRHSRSSFSSQILSTPEETPPPLDGGVSSVITSPSFSPRESDLLTCKWTTDVKGIKVVCGASFSDPCALQEHLVSRHMGTVHGAKGPGHYCCWQGCNRPDEPFSQKSKLQGHFLTHSNYKNFHCSVCGKLFARQATLERHERSHRGEKPYQCSECGKSFTDSSELKTHSRTHTGEKPFKCTYPGCTFQTGDSSNMSSHRLTHGERRHKCQFPGCSKSFTRPDQLKRHMKSTHKNESLILPPPFPSDQFLLAFDPVG